MNGEFWAIGWGEKVWTNAPAAALAGVDAIPVTLGQYARVATELDLDDWSVCQPDRSPLVLSVWISVLGVEDGVWADLPAARAELAATPLSTIAGCLVALQDDR